MNVRALLFVLAFALPCFAHPPVSVVVDARGNAYYSDLAQVWRVAPDGTRSVAVPGVHTHELYLDAHGNLFGEHLWYEGERTDKWGHYVWRRSPDGRVVKVIPPTEGFLQRYSFVRDAAGNMYRPTDDRKRVEKYAPDGKVTTVASNLKNIRWMIATAEGTLYLTDQTDLVRITLRGEAKRIAGNLAEASIWRLQFDTNHAVMGLWTDRAGNVYAAAYSEGKVRKITPGGEVTTFYESSRGWSPVGGAFAPNGDLLLLEWSRTNKARLVRIAIAPRNAGVPPAERGASRSRGAAGRRVLSRRDGGVPVTKKRARAPDGEPFRRGARAVSPSRGHAPRDNSLESDQRLVRTRWARRFCDHAASSEPVSNGRSSP